MSNSPDVERVRRFLRTRSERAFRRLYRAHAGYLYCLALRMTGGRRETAEDAIQEAWIRACERLPAFEWRSSLRSWLGGIVINCCREATRREIRREADDTSVEETGASGANDVDRLDLERLISGLPDGQREVLVLFHLEGFTHEEIAAQLGIAAGTSKSRLFEARRTLRRWLDPSADREGTVS